MPPSWWVRLQRELFSAVCGAFFGVGFCWMSELNWSLWLHNSRVQREEHARNRAGVGGVGTLLSHNNGDTPLKSHSYFIIEV